MSQSRRKHAEVTLEDLIRLYESLSEAKKKEFYRRWKVETPVLDSGRRREVVQDAVRMQRLKDRADGIEFALRYDDLTYRQRREMEQMLKNLRLAARGMEKILEK